MGLRIASFTLSTQDVPGMWSLVVFLKGCNFRCKHCHNWEIVLSREGSEVSEEDIVFEASHNPAIQAVVISGGEPSLYPIQELEAFIDRLKSANPRIKVRIDTNGYRPEFIRDIKSKVDGFAVDIKSPIENKELYSYTVGREVNPRLIEESLHLADGMELTLFRTPNYPWLSEEDKEKIRSLTAPLSSEWYLNNFVHVSGCPFNDTPH
jgi:pyruvate formate lyase activating enzyme